LSDFDDWWRRGDRNCCLSSREPIDYGSVPSITSTTNVALKNALCRLDRLARGHLDLRADIIIDMVQSYIKNTSHPSAKIECSESHVYE